MSLFKELKRRNVFRVAIAYLVVGWLLVQVLGIATDSFEAPAWVMKLFITLIAIGFIPTVLFSWAFELTPEGLKKESEIDTDKSQVMHAAKKLDYITILAAVVVAAMFAWQQLNHSNGGLKNNTPIVEHNVNDKIIDHMGVDPVSDNSKNTNEPALGDKSIAVLPFENRSPDENDAYFTDGIHDDLLTQLSKVNAFKVISRTSVMEYRTTSKNIKQIGEELGVATIMEGAVQRSGKRIRINVQLIDARTDEHLWAEIYDRTLTTDNLFDIQSEISKKIAVSLKAHLAPEILASVKKAPTQSLKAYEYYLQGNKANKSNTVEKLKKSIILYKLAIEEDPMFKQAWTSLSYSQTYLYWFSDGDLNLIKQARESLDAAAIIDPDFVELYIAEGNYFYSGFLDYQKAFFWYDKAIAVMPNNADVYMQKGWSLRRAGFLQQAVDNMQQSLALNPRNGFNLSELATTLQYLHRFSESQQALDKAKAIDGLDHWYKYTGTIQRLMAEGDINQALDISTGLQFVDNSEIADTYLQAHILAREFENVRTVVNGQMGQFEIWRWQINLQQDYLAQIDFFSGNITQAKLEATTALERLKKMREKLGDDYRIYTPEARMNAILGNSQQVKSLIHETIKIRPKDAVTEMKDNYEHARIFAMSGLIDEAVTSLEPQLSPPSSTTVHYVDLDPAFDGIRDTEAFQAMLARHANQNKNEQGIGSFK